MRLGVVLFAFAVCAAAACNSVEVAPILDDAGSPPDASQASDASDGSSETDASDTSDALDAAVD